jgi:tetratricopeptide (TPR) repeat protein
VPQYRRDAVVHFERALELDPTNVEARFQFAVLYEELNLPWRARPHYERVVELDPNHREARARLRQLESAEKKKDHPEVSLLGRLLSRLSK